MQVVRWLTALSLDACRSKCESVALARRLSIQSSQMRFRSTPVVPDAWLWLSLDACCSKCKVVALARHLLSQSSQVRSRSAPVDPNENAQLEMLFSSSGTHLSDFPEVLSCSCQPNGAPFFGRRNKYFLRFTDSRRGFFETLPNES